MVVIPFSKDQNCPSGCNATDSWMTILFSRGREWYLNGNYLVIFVSIGIILPLSLLKNLGKSTTTVYSNAYRVVSLCLCLS